MDNDTSLVTQLELVLSLQLVIAAFVAIVWSKNRWGRGQRWIVGMPVMIAAVWLASGVAVRLLPNLL